MMRVSLINLGDGGRALYDSKGKIVSIPIGEIVSADLDEQTLKRLSKFKSSDTLFVAPEGKITPPMALRAALDLMKVVDDDPYESILQRYFEIVHPRSSMDIRPSRGQVKLGLRGVISDHLERVMAHGGDTPVQVQVQVPVKDDVGEDTLKREEKEMEDRQRSHREAASRVKEQVRRHKRR